MTWKNRIPKKIMAATLTGLLLLGGLAGCKGKTPSAIQATASEAPQSEVANYYEPDQALSGGSQVSMANLKDVKVEQEGEDLVVTLSFMQGSQTMGMEESIASGVPTYSTQWYPGVNRLAVKLEGVSFWEYRVYEDEIQDTVVQGMFHQSPVNDAAGWFYLQLSDDVAYRMEEVGNALRILLRPKGKQPQSQWYFMVDGFEAFPGNPILGEMSLAPTLSADGSSVVLLSKPFDSEEECQTFLTNNDAVLQRVLPGKTPKVLELTSNTLPEFDLSSELTALANTPIGRKGEEQVKGEVLEGNGRFLCWTPDRSAFVFSRPFYVSDVQDNEMLSYEQLWLSNVETGASALLPDYEFASILSAEYSPDGRYLAFIEQSRTNRSLQVYDTQTQQLMSAAEEGFGVDTPSFCWDSDKPVLYAITGEGEWLQLMSYDLTVETSRVKVLEEAGCQEGALLYHGGKLYLTQTSEDSQETSIKSFDLATGEHADVCAGYAFDLHGDLMAVAEDGAATRFSIYNLADGTSTSICEDQDVVDFVWDVSGKAVYYIVYRDTEGEESYPMALYRYDLENATSTAIMDMVSGALYPASGEDACVMVYIYTQRREAVPASYRISMLP